MRFERWFYTMRLRVRSLFRRQTVEQELSEEIQYHLQRQIEDNLTHGMTAPEARFAAMRAIGGLEQRKEECRDARRVRFAEDLTRDVAYALRVLRKSPVFTATAILSLTLGIGANTAIFSVVNAILLRPLPVPEPEQLVLLKSFSRNGSVNTFANPDYEQLRDRASMFSGIAAASSLVPVDAGVGSEIERAQAEVVSDNYFSVLGVEPAAGRIITKDDGEVPVAVISDRFWKRSFNEDPSVVGRALNLNGTAFTIIGVAPAQFLGVTAGGTPDVWVPIGMVRAIRPGRFDLRAVRYVDWLHVIGRLQPDVTIAQARLAIDVLVPQIQRDLGIDAQRDYLHHIELEPGSGGVSLFRGRFGYSTLVVWAVVAMVLLVACLNLAGMLLARGTTRQREIATRLAIGASRTRIVRQLLTESALLTLFGALIGLLFSSWSTSVIAQMLSAQGLTLELAIDGRVLSFTAIVAVLAAIVFGLTPALRSVKESVRTVIAGRRGYRLRRALLVGQVALSVLLVTGAGLFIGTLRNLKNVDAGFHPEGVLQVRFDASRDGNARLGGVATRLVERITAIPGVVAATFAVNGTLANSGSGVTGLVFDDAVPADTIDKRVSADWVGPAYFETLQIPIVAGREFSDADTANSARVVIVNQTMARQFFGDGRVLGRTIRWNDQKLEVIGIAKDAKYRELRESTPPMLYFASLQNATGFNVVEIRTGDSPLALAGAVRQAVREVDPALRIGNITSLEDRIDQKLAAERFVADISGFFSGLTMFLVAIGIYAMLAQTVAQRTNEFGVRTALGAQRKNLIAMVLQDAAWTLAAGLLLGIPAVLASGRLVSSMLFGLEPSDATTITLAAIVVSAAGLTAAYIPARRASHIDPMAALRHE